MFSILGTKLKARPERVFVGEFNDKQMLLFLEIVFVGLLDATSDFHGLTHSAFGLYGRFAVLLRL